MPEIVLPLPPRELSPNYKHLNSAVKWRYVRHYREACGWDTKYQMQEQGLSPIWQSPIVMKLSFHYRLRRERDEDNLLASFKAGIDGMVDAKLLPDDSTSHVSYVIEVVAGEDEGVYVSWE